MPGQGALHSYRPPFHFEAAVGSADKLKYKKNTESFSTQNDRYLLVKRTISTDGTASMILTSS